MVKRAIALDGTCKRPGHSHYLKPRNHFTTGTGEHGVGIGKKEYLYEELGEGTVELMKSIKHTIDPFNLFNPGKVSTSPHAVLCNKLNRDQLYPDKPVDSSLEGRKH